MKKQLLSLLVLISGTVLQANAQYYINTIAGTGTAGYTGDGGQATSAELYNPIHTAADNKGNLIIADNINNRIRKIDASGIITTIAGTGTAGNTGDGGQATAAELYAPTSVAVDDSGNIYIATRQSWVVRKIDKNGIITNFAGNGSAGYSGDGGQATDAKLGTLRGVAVDDTGNVYIAELQNSVIRKVNKSTGIITTVAGNGTQGYSGDNGPATNAQLNFAAMVAIGDSGNIFIADYFNNVIRKVNNKGIITTFAGNHGTGYYGDGGPATSAAIDTPTGVAADRNGNVFITNFYSERVRMVDKNGIINAIAGTGTRGHTGDGGLALSAELYSSAGISIDKSGNLYVSELSGPGNDDIRELATSCNASFILNPQNLPLLCYGSSIVLWASNSTDTGYTWSPATGLSSTRGDTVTATLTADITYTVTGYNAGGCTATQTIELNPGIAPNKPLINISVTGDSLISSAIKGNQWYFNDTLLVSDTSRILVITGHRKGFYKVTVINPANGCSSTSDSTTSINQLATISNQLSIYPNPTIGSIFIIINSSAQNLNEWNLKVTDVLGRTLLTKSSLSYSNEIELPSADGFYFITVTNKTGRAVFPVVKQ